MTTSSSERGISLGMPELPAPDYPDDVRARLERDAREIIERYPDSRSALLPMLHLVQSEEGHVTRTGMQFCADMLDLTTAEVTAVATFYTMYRRRPSGDYQVGVCTNTLCAVMGGDAIFSALQEHLGVGNGETTDDGKVTLEHIECNAACDFAPVVMVNWEFFDNQTPRAPGASSTTCGRTGRSNPPAVRPCAPSRRPPGCWPVSPTNGRVPSTRAAAPVPPRWSGCGCPRARPPRRVWCTRGTADRTTSRDRDPCTSRLRPSTSVRTTRHRTHRPPTRPTRRVPSRRRGVMTVTTEDGGPPARASSRAGERSAPRSCCRPFCPPSGTRRSPGRWTSTGGTRGTKGCARRSPCRPTRSSRTSRTRGCADAAAPASRRG